MSDFFTKCLEYVLEATYNMGMNRNEKAAAQIVKNIIGLAKVSVVQAGLELSLRHHELTSSEVAQCLGVITQLAYDAGRAVSK